MTRHLILCHDAQQRRPPSSGRALDAKPAPEARLPGMSVLGVGSNVMEELRKAAMKVKQATTKPAAVSPSMHPFMLSESME